MPLDADIIKLLKSQGYRINDEIELAIEELIDTVQDENDEMDSDDEDALDDTDPEDEE